MKKRTVITTETREVWVISGGVTQENVVLPQSVDVGKVDNNETLVSTGGVDQNAPSIPEKDTQ